MDLKATLAIDNIKLPDNFFHNIQKYKEHLFKWNKIHNLTGAKDEETLNHFIYDAVFPISFLGISATDTNKRSPVPLLLSALPMYPANAIRLPLPER